MWDYLLPGSIIVLKFGLRMTTDQETNGADTVRAFVVFPVDIAFLSLSYGSAILYSAQPTSAAPVKAILTTAFVAIALLLPVIVISKKSERALVLSKTKQAAILAALGYGLAIIITIVSVSIGGTFQ